jgi:hypothetical protein
LFLSFQCFVINFANASRAGNGACSVEKVAIDELKLEDLQGRPVNLQDYCKEYTLLIFLRHLA